MHILSQFTGTQKTWITTQFACMFLQILFAGVILSLSFSFSCSFSSFFSDYSPHIDLKLDYNYYLQCRFDIGILVFVPWVSLCSFFFLNFKWVVGNHRLTSVVHVWTERYFLLAALIAGFNLIMDSDFLSLQGPECWSFVFGDSFSCSLHACHATIQSDWWYLASDGTS